MVVPHAANVGVSPQREDLPNDGHPAQGAVNQLHDVSIAHLLKMESTSVLGREKSGVFSLSHLCFTSQTCQFSQGRKKKNWMRNDTLE